LIYLDSSVAARPVVRGGSIAARCALGGAAGLHRLLECEVWNHAHARGLGLAFSGSTQALIGRVRLLELVPTILARALQPFSVPVRILDALHLATIDFIRGQGETVELASYDNRLIRAARTLGMALCEL
jgi:hypothetical protein